MSQNLWTDYDEIFTTGLLLGHEKQGMSYYSDPDRTPDSD